MQKISRLVTAFIFIASFTIPTLVSATVGAGGTCVSGIECNSGVCSGGYCIGGGTNPITSGSGGININAIRPYSEGIKNVINDILVPVLMAVAFIVFLWGVFKYFIWGGENESDKAEGRKFAMWGVIGFVVILSLWGLVNLVMGTLGFSTSTLAPRPPTI